MDDATTQQLQDDLTALKDFKKNLEDERDELDDVLAQAGQDVERQTAEPVKEFDQATNELDRLEQQAEEEEQAGAIKQARQDIASN